MAHPHMSLVILWTNIHILIDRTILHEIYVKKRINTEAFAFSQMSSDCMAGCVTVKAFEVG